MKRVETEAQEVARLYCIGKTYPLLFWRACVSCSHDFRREVMYEFAHQHPLSMRPSWSHICKTCAPDIATAAKLVSIYVGPATMTPPAEE